MKKRQRITGHTAAAAAAPAAAAATAAGIPKKKTTFLRCLCFRVTSKSVARVVQLALLALVIFTEFAGCLAVGYSYSRFEGPVVGPEQLVQVPDAYGGGTHSDYVARPEYSFAYGVEDGQTRVLQNRKETRHGDEVRGVYSVVDPDGTLRVVKYTADDTNGFQAEVITNGVATLHGHGNEGVAGGGAAVEQQVQHEQANEVDHGDDDDDDDGGDAAEQQDGEEQEEEDDQAEDAPQQGKGQYKVHENYDEGDGGGEGDDGAEAEENEGGGDHEEYEGSSEEGYEEANAHSQQQDEQDSDEY